MNVSFRAPLVLLALTVVAPAMGFEPVRIQSCAHLLSDAECSDACASCVACDAACDPCCTPALGSTGGLGGLLNGSLYSDTAFDDFISPMSNFVFFEDPRTVTELRPIFVNHWVPNPVSPTLTGGGTIQLYAAQLRVALTERLSLIAVKDGFIVDHTNNALDTVLHDGWGAVSAGLKYNFLRDVQSGTLASAGMTYEMPIGSQRALQDVGAGEFHFFLSAGKRMLDGDAHWIGAFGLRQPTNDNRQPSSTHLSNHFDVRLTERFYLLSETVWWNWLRSAPAGAALGVAGQDLFNLSANNVSGNDLVTQAVGAKFKPSRRTEVGMAYEFPLTAFKDVLESRITADLILRY